MTEIKNAWKIETSGDTIIMENNMPDTLGSRIRKLRLKHAPEPYKLTLTGLAGMVGTSRGYLWELEKDKRKDPGARLLFKIAKVLGTTVESLLTGKNQ